jgi:hypothetical protein
VADYEGSTWLYIESSVALDLSALEPRVAVKISDLPPEERKTRALVQRLSQLVDGAMSKAQLHDLLLNGLLYRKSAYYREEPGDDDSDPYESDEEKDVKA